MKTKRRQHMLSVALVLYLCLLIGTERAQAQEQSHVVQLSGMVVAGDSARGMAGVAVFVPNTTRGIHTNPNGFFSMPVLPGDSVVIAALGFQRQYIIIPSRYASHSYATTIQLQESLTELPTVDVMPWATERDLQVAITKVKLPKEPELKVDLGPLQYNSVLEGPAMDAGANAKHGIQQQLRQQERRHMVPSDVRIFGIPIR